MAILARGALCSFFFPSLSSFLDWNHMSTSRTARRGELSALQERLGYQFTDIRILKQALNLRKISATEGRGYDRLEKIGDRLLYPVILWLIQDTYDKAPLCEVTRMERVLTTNRNLAHLAVRLDLMPVLAQLYPEFVYVEKTLADLFESICAAIAKDAGSGDFLLGISRLRSVCRSLFAVDLALAQIDNPFPMLIYTAKRRWNQQIRHEWVSISYNKQPIGYTCKLYLKKKAAQAYGLAQKKNPFIAGTGVTTEQALQKAAALALLKLMPKRFPNDLPELGKFSWRIKPQRT